MTSPQIWVRAAGLSLAAAALLAGCKHTPEEAEGPHPPSLTALTQGEVVEGFSTRALYTNNADGVMGARFVHEHSGFTFDYLQIQSVPQSFIWVGSYPDSDRGEPHTQEHLLLGKGNRGRYVASQEDMSLVSSSAFTQQYRTCYHLHSTAGSEVFFDILDARLDSLINPDYTDEEIRREVHHYGVSAAADGTLELEEKGTVYQEMSSTSERPGSRLWEALEDVSYGVDHPLSWSSGGTPDAIRTMTPEHIRTFHAEHYQLGNMGMIGAFPQELGLGEVLARMDTILKGIQPEPTAEDARWMTADDLPPPTGPEPGQIRFVDYPSQSTQVPSNAVLVWPPQLKLDYEERLLMGLFLEALASTPSSNLYRRLVDTSSRQVEIDATEVYAWVGDDQGNPVYAGAGGIPASSVDEATAAEIRSQILDELRTISQWSEGDEALADFNRRVRSSIVARRRSLGRFVDSPPGFGFRHGGGSWMSHIATLSESDDFRRSLTMKGELAAAEAVLDQAGNPWADRISQWKLLDVEPTVLVTRPSAQLLQALSDAREARLNAQVAKIMETYGSDEPQEALRRFKEVYDAQTLALEEAARDVPMPRFIDTPPMTLDDQLVYSQATVGAGEIPLVRSSFNNMSSTTIGLALRADSATPDQWVYLAALPRLMRRVGIADGERLIPYTEVGERIQNEILDLGVSINANFITDRVELVVTASGSNLEEAQKALGWMGDVLYHADWRPENLSRIRDVLNEDLGNLRQVMSGSEESWVQDPAQAWRRQDNPLLLTTGSFLTQTHHIMRLRWLLEGGDPTVTQPATAFLDALGTAAQGQDRDALAQLLAALNGSGPAPDFGAAVWEQHAALGDEAKALAKKAVTDLDASLGDLPDSSLTEDWAYLCRQMQLDLAVAPATALALLDALRSQLLVASGARMYAVGSDENVAALAGGFEALTAGLSTDAPFAAANLPPGGVVSERLSTRGAPPQPLYVGLVNPNTQGGVLIHSANSPSYYDTNEEDLLDYLSGQLFAGGGAHSLFMKTWGAGLAYSNGIRPSPRSGRLNYYAERSPALPRTMAFVVGELAGASEDPNLAEYAISGAFKGSRAAQGYESRGAAMAADLADGLTPEVVSTFRSAILDVRHRSDLAAQLFGRMESVYGKVLVGYGPNGSDVEGAVYLSIGPEAQLEAWEGYIKEKEGDENKLVRLYPRDFWITGEAGQ